MSTLRLYITAALLFIAMVLCGVIGLRQRVGIILLMLLSVVWLTVDRGWEGGIIVVVNRRHGLTTADLVGLAGLLVAGWLAWRSLRRRG